VYGGSGLAYTYGYPNSIDGNAPSIFQVKTQMALYNRPDTYQLASAKETARGAQLGAQGKSDEVAYRTASLYLDALQAENTASTFNNQTPSLSKVVDVMTAQVQAGTELPIELKRSQVNLADAQQRLNAAKMDADYLEMVLAVTLGYPATDRVHPTDSKLPDMPEVQTEDEATDMALRNNKELRQMQSNVLAKEMELRSYKAEKLPQVDLVAQYSLFAKYNYSQYFQKFQRNNFQLGASITVPLIVGSAARARADQAMTDMQKLRVQMEQVRNRVTTDTRRDYQEWKKAQQSRDLARMQLDLAREDLSVLLAQNGEGRVPLSRVEQARIEESNRWISLYEAETAVTRAQLAILRQMGTLAAMVRSTPAEPKP
jgi:outer membrane protein TolC